MSSNSYKPSQLSRSDDKEKQLQSELTVARGTLVRLHRDAALHKHKIKLIKEISSLFFPLVAPLCAFSPVHKINSTSFFKQLTSNPAVQVTRSTASKKTNNPFLYTYLYPLEFYSSSILSISSNFLSRSI